MELIYNNESLNNSTKYDRRVLQMRMKMKMRMIIKMKMKNGNENEKRE